MNTKQLLACFKGVCLTAVCALMATDLFQPSLQGQVTFLPTRPPSNDVEIDNLIRVPMRDGLPPQTQQEATLSVFGLTPAGSPQFL